MRHLFLLALTAACSPVLPEPKNSVDTDAATKPPGGGGGGGGGGSLGDQDTFAPPSDTGGLGGDTSASNNGGGNGGGRNNNGGAPGGANTGVNNGGTLTPGPVTQISPTWGYAVAEMAINNDGDAAAYLYRSPTSGTLYTNNPILLLWLIQQDPTGAAPDVVCIMGFEVVANAIAPVLPGGDDAALQTWLNANGHLSGFALRTGTYATLGPFDYNSGAACEIDAAVWGADPFEGFLSNVGGSDATAYVGFGGTIDSDADLYRVIFGLNTSLGFPPDDRWFGGNLELTYEIDDIFGTPTKTLPTATYAQTLPSDMIFDPTVAPTWVDPATLPAPGTGPAPRAIYTAWPSFQFDFDAAVP